MQGLKGKNVLVTGGSSGIGQAIAVRFGREGANVAINYHGSRDGAEETETRIQAAYESCVESVRACGVRVSLIRADVSAEKEVEAMIEQAADELGPLHVLVNNAGIQIAADSHEADTEEFDRVLGVNLRGAFLCAREMLRRWVESEAPGTIINISSVHEVIPKPRFIGYSVSKGGMRNLTRTLALEYADRGIRVNAVGPGATITPMNDAWQDDPEKRREVEGQIPMRRAGTAEEMAAAVAFLCSDEAAYITGQTLFVDGGLTLYPAFMTAWSSE
jgi:glucose 1-dehydrogenase